MEMNKLCRSRKKHINLIKFDGSYRMLNSYEALKN